MSEYWKSNPRKFCDFCKCWIADNKPSVDFHERGKRHKENVQIRLAEMAKKGKEDYEAQQQEGDFLKAMEEAALKAYKDDIQHNPDMTATKISEIASAKNAEIVIKTKKAPEEKPKEEPTVKKWYEAKSPEGYCYYWNIETGASKWDEPEEGFLTLAEQDKLKEKDKQESNSTEESEKDVKDKKKDKKENSLAGESGKVVKDKKKSKQENKSAGESGKVAKDKKSTTISAPAIVFGPLKKAEAYSSWKEVRNDAEKTTDYQLPQLVEEEYYGPDIFKRPGVTFKEKTVTLSAGEKCIGETVSFKKRKSAQDHKKSMRQRTNDL